jgi:hypothetical protein
VTLLFLLAPLCGRKEGLFGNGLVRGRAFKKGGITHTFEQSLMPSTGGGKAPNGRQLRAQLREGLLGHDEGT